MQCERAQEFFSDYLERTLDRPMTVALEAHLTGCSGCRAEIEALQATYAALDTLPEVEPPPDGAWQVIHQLRQARQDQAVPTGPAVVQPEIRRQPEMVGGWIGFLQWLRSLSPASAAMAGALATLVVGGAFLATRTPDHERLAVIGVPRGNGPTAPAVPSALPQISVSYGRLTPAGQEVNLRLTPAANLSAAQVRVTGGGINFTHPVSGELGPTRPLELAVPVYTAGKPAEAFRVVLEARPRGYQGMVVVPLGGRSRSPVTLTVVDQPLEEVLKQLAPQLGAPVVVDGDAQATVSLQVVEAEPAAAMGELAARLNATVRTEGGVYRLSPQ